MTGTSGDADRDAGQRIGAIDSVLEPVRHALELGRARAELSDATIARLEAELAGAREDVRTLGDDRDSLRRSLAELRGENRRLRRELLERQAAMVAQGLQGERS